MPDDKKNDDSWKEEARREKERLAEELDGKTAAGAEDGPPLPEPDFMTFLGGLAAQVMIHLGEVESPFSGKRQVDLPAARYHIDLIGILEEKTRGNLTADEESEIRSLLTGLRMRYVSAEGGGPGGAASSGAGEGNA